MFTAPSTRALETRQRPERETSPGRPSTRHPTRPHPTTHHGKIFAGSRVRSRRCWHAASCRSNVSHRSQREVCVRRHGPVALCCFCFFFSSSPPQKYICAPLTLASSLVPFSQGCCVAPRIVAPLRRFPPRLFPLKRCIRPHESAGVPRLLVTHHGTDSTSSSRSVR